MKDLHGLFRRSPYLAGMLALCLFTLAGIPPTVGFFAKFYLLKIAFQAGYYTVVVVGLLTAVIAAFYYIRIISVMFFSAPEETTPPQTSWPALIVGIASFAALVLFSFYPEPLFALLTLTG